MRPYIQTFTGKLFTFHPLDPNNLDIRDIAHHLSQVNRFTGATKRPYSVAEHSVRVSQLAGAAVHAYGGSKDHVQHVTRYALLHDASEAYMNDIATPLKHLPEMSGYRALEKRVQAFILNHFGLGSIMPDAVRVADETICNWEADELLPGGRQRTEGWPDRMAALDLQHFGLSAPDAEQTFLTAYHFLFDA